ncbi:hypothetical protein RR48_04612 [Papilio machaon]|uniref:Uncharacterized protein n=1 Tax=Papilio machaon TaxID=76193 RepID=A0A0N1PGY1_PAPMA|nr:hypothetical protein RR48_04612 [Papilio machaon]
MNIYILLAICCVVYGHTNDRLLRRRKRGAEGATGALDIVTNNAQPIHAEVKRENAEAVEKTLTLQPCSESQRKVVPSKIEPGVVFQVNSRIKRLQEDESISEENAQSNVESKPSNEDLINLRLGDVTRPISQNIPKLSNIKNILTSSIPIPVQLLLGDNQNQPNELNTKPNNTQDIEESNKNNNIDSNIVPTNIGRLAKKKIAKKINDDSENMEITDISRRSQAPNNLENNNSRNLVLENKLNNRNINTEKIISPENYNKEHLFDEAIIPLLKVLGNSLKISELDTTNSDNKQQKTLENKIPEEHKLSNILDDTKDLDNTDVMSAEKVTKILEEQNNLLKDILFKTLNFKNETNVDNEEKDTKKIHLILDINNSDAKENGKDFKR